jgi:Ala-tRNA(Pro) deacylase
MQAPTLAPSGPSLFCFHDEMGGQMYQYLKKVPTLKAAIVQPTLPPALPNEKTAKLKAPAPVPAAKAGAKGFTLAGDGPVAQCKNLLATLGLACKQVSHVAVVATEGGMSSNENHHEVLKEEIGYTSGTYPPTDAKGHVVVSLFLKGKKKKELILVVKKPATAFNMTEFGKKYGIAGGLRFAAADQMMKSLGVVQDFVSPLALVNDSACEVRVVFDEALKDGTSWVLPPGVNTESVGMSIDDLLKFAQHGNRKAEVLPL